MLLGYSLKQQGQYPDAIEALTRATRANPEDIDAWNGLADTQRRAGRPGASARTLERAVDIDPTSPITRFLMGEAYREDGRYEAATIAYQDALRLMPQLEPAWFGLGLTLLRSGRLDGLDAVAARLQQLDPALARELARLRSEAAAGRK